MVIAFGLMSANLTLAQKATEIYIPIGESPGVSESVSIIGTISYVDYSDDMIEVAAADGMKPVKVEPDTEFFLDRSRYAKQNTQGEMQDCKVGSKVEVKLSKDGTADWIKIETD